MSTLRTLNLTKSYGGRTVVRGVNVDVSSGEIVGLLGPNGAGKTTTFYMTVGLTQPDSGRVELDGQDLTDDPMYIRARKGIGYLPQEPSIFRGLTVEQNRETKGAKMIYTTEDETYVITGTPVKIVDQCQRETVGRTLTFNKGTDSIVVDGNSQIRTQTKGGNGKCTS